MQVFVHLAIRDVSDPTDERLLFSTRAEEGGAGHPIGFRLEPKAGLRAPRGWEVVLKGEDVPSGPPSTPHGPQTTPRPSVLCCPGPLPRLRHEACVAYCLVSCKCTCLGCPVYGLLLMLD